MDSKIRTIFEFYKDGEAIRSVLKKETVPNIMVGQRVCFDHDQTSKTLNGTVSNITHTVFADESTVTYVEVDVS